MTKKWEESRVPKGHFFCHQCFCPYSCQKGFFIPHPAGSLFRTDIPLGKTQSQSPMVQYSAYEMTLSDFGLVSSMEQVLARVTDESIKLSPAETGEFLRAIPAVLWFFNPSVNGAELARRVKLTGAINEALTVGGWRTYPLRDKLTYAA